MSRGAHAFRDFDGERILSRPYFRKWREEYQIDAGQTDEEILSKLKAAEGDSIDALEEKLRAIKAAHGRLETFHQLMKRHINRCDRYNKSKMKTLGLELTELKRHAPTLEYLTSDLDCVELLDKFFNRYYGLEKIIQKRYREEFAGRLKRARKTAGLTQKQLGELIQIKVTTLSQYETAQRDPAIPTICRLLKVLPREELLGK